MRVGEDGGVPVVTQRRGSGRSAGLVPWTLGALALAALAAFPVHSAVLGPAPWARLVDLEVYRDAGVSLLTGRPVYDHLTPVPNLLPFTYPPLAALLAVPLAVLPLAVVQAAWTLLQLAALATVVAMAFAPLLARLERWSPVGVGAVAGGCCWLVPVRDGFGFGQVDILLVALCLADCTRRRYRPPGWAGRLPAGSVRQLPFRLLDRLPAGVLVGLATAVKLTPGVFVVHLAVAGRRRAAITAGLTAVGLTAVVGLALPETSWAYWAGALFDSGRLGPNAGTANQSLRGVLLRVGPDGAAGTALWLLCGAVVAWYGFRAAARAARAGDDVRAVALVGLLAVLLSPVAWIHHLAWVVVVLGALVADGRSGSRWLLAAGTAAFFAVAVPWQGVTLLGGDTPYWWGRTVQQGYCLGALVLLVVLDRVRPAARRDHARAATDRA